MKIPKHILACLAISTALSSCNKKEIEDEDADNIRPTISNVLINGQAFIDSTEVKDTLHLSALLSDDHELRRVDIIVEGAGLRSNWKETKRIDLEGKSQHIEHNIFVWPHVWSASYVVKFEIRDSRGNKTYHETQPFWVANNGGPKVNNLVIDFDDGDYDYRNGDTLRFWGTVTDDLDITSVQIEMDIPSGYSGDRDYFDTKFELKQPNDTLWDFEKDGQLKIYFPPYSKNGNYSLEIRILDNEHNINHLSKMVGI